MMECPKCLGRGKYLPDVCVTATVIIDMSIDCEICGGSGEIDKREAMIKYTVLLLDEARDMKKIIREIRSDMELINKKLKVEEW